MQPTWEPGQPLVETAALAQLCGSITVEGGGRGGFELKSLAPTPEKPGMADSLILRSRSNILQHGHQAASIKNPYADLKDPNAPIRIRSETPPILHTS